MRHSRIRHNSGMGGFLCPPTHPMHTKSVETETHMRPARRGCMSLECAVQSCDDPETVAEAKAILDAWQAPPLDNPEVIEWTRQVLGYFCRCYLPDNKSRHCTDLVIDDRDPLINADRHRGVDLIRQYYPDYQPTQDDFDKAYWGKKPE